MTQTNKAKPKQIRDHEQSLKRKHSPERVCFWFFPFRCTHLSSVYRKRMIFLLLFTEYVKQERNKGSKKRIIFCSRPTGAKLSKKKKSKTQLKLACES